MRISPLLCALLLVPALAFSPAYAGEHNDASDSRNMESLLVESILSVSNNKLDVALNEVNSLLKINPNFKLAQLVKGDLLLARTRPLSDFGNAPGAAQRLEDFRDEARVRLHRIQEQSPAALVPEYLWHLDAQQRYAIVVDLGKSTLYLYENVNGEPRYVADYYITSGKKGSEKLVEGDQKTPVGVYFIKSMLSKNKLTDFYGPVAYPLSYPNEWDRREGRDGHGIWLHGTPSNTYSRPPRASNGCVVLTNEDLLQVGKLLQVGVTPVIITSQMDWSDKQSDADRTALLHEIEQWRADWASIDTDAYLAHYAHDFSSNGANLSDWARQKKLVNSGKSWIKLNLSNLSVFSYPNQPDLAVVDFDQDYESNNLNDRMKKRQYWMKRDNRWQIVYEGAA